MYNNKTYLDISFVNIDNDKDMRLFKQAIVQINACVVKKIKKKNKSLKFTNSIKKSSNVYPDRLRLSIKDDILVFNENKTIIDFDYIQPKMYVKILIHPESIWTNEESFGITWNVLQLKLYTKLILNTYSFIDDEPSNTKYQKYKDDPKYQKYFKMIKMGIPLDAIKLKMICDNLDPNILDPNILDPNILDPKESSKKTSSSTYKSVISPKTVSSPPVAPINMLAQIKKAKQQKANKLSIVKKISKETPLCFRPSENEIMNQLKKLKKFKKFKKLNKSNTAPSQ
jgi:hypothetical protein